ncbi:MAG: MFS transporter [Candidatus Omnitrophica bacterium]|nr:MFS transporter [Candidatus Omnitrophota bacterium]
MQEKATFDSHKMLFLNTLAFVVCFASWMLNGVLVTFLSTNQVFSWGPVEIGWLMGIPVLTGAIARLPAGMLTDKFGGKPVFGSLLILSAVPMYLLSTANNFSSFALYSFGFGLTGASFAIGIAYSSLWYPKNLQGTVLGIFGAGNMGAALTTFFAPGLLNVFTNNGANLEGWKTLPKCYAALLLGMGIIFLIFATNKKPLSHSKSLVQMLKPLQNIRVWRFGLYYSLFFGCFVAFSQWLLNYYVSAYYLPLVTAGFLTTCFSLPTGAIRALGGWMSDRWGARSVLYAVLLLAILFSFLLIIPKMDIYSPGQGVVATNAGVVTAITSKEIVIGDKKYPYILKADQLENFDDKLMAFPTKTVWQEPAVKEGQKVQRKQLLAKGITRIYFQANVWIFTLFVFVLGIVFGIGSAAVYKHIPTYFPEEVGVVGGMVGVLGALGGFFCPLIFGYLLEYTGLWTSCWMLTFALSVLCLLWMHYVIVRDLQNSSRT